MALRVDFSDLPLARSPRRGAIARFAAAYQSEDAFVAGLLLLFGVAGMWLAFLDAAGASQLCALSGG